jgi:hypothetical protein
MADFNNQALRKTIFTSLTKVSTLYGVALAIAVVAGYLPPGSHCRPSSGRALDHGALLAMIA